MIVKERLYLTADNKEVVREGDKRAAYLLYGIGDEINERLAERYGIIGGRMTNDEKSVGAKNLSPEPQNKEIRTAEDKGKYPARKSRH